MVLQSVDKLGFNGGWRHQESQVVGEFVLGGDDRAVPEGVELRSTRPSKDLSHIKDAEVHKASLFCIIDLRSLKYIHFECVNSRYNNQIIA